MKYYLIGMPGSGKSTVGKEIARITKYKFIDLDKYIEKKEGMTIPEIFEKNGVDYFRTLETKSLIELKDEDDVVISCGGGIVVTPQNKEEMNGFVVYLKVSLENLKIRVSSDAQNKRPLLNTNSIEELYEARKNLYLDFQNFTISNTIVSNCAKEIIKEGKSYAKKKGISH